MLPVIVAIAILCGVFAPVQNQAQPPPPEEIRIGDVAEEVAEPDEVKDANAENGWYKKTNGGWSFWPEKSVEGEKPPKAVAAKVDSESIETAGGVVIFIVLIMLARKLSGGKKKKAAPIKDGVSHVQYQALMRRLDGMSRILENVVPESDDGAKVERGRKRR